MLTHAYLILRHFIWKYAIYLSQVEGCASFEAEDNLASSTLLVLKYLNLMQRTVSKSAQSKTKLLASKASDITPPVAAAVELIVSLMSIQQGGGTVPPDSHTALTRRFPSEIISAAFAHLRLLNYVLHGDSGNRFRLSNDFISLVKVSRFRL